VNLCTFRHPDEWSRDFRGTTRLCESLNLQPGTIPFFWVTRSRPRLGANLNQALGHPSSQVRPAKAGGENRFFNATFGLRELPLLQVCYFGRSRGRSEVRISCR
jgi:hypothetical protein